jgi:hypothetical protein
MVLTLEKIVDCACNVYHSFKAEWKHVAEIRELKLLLILDFFLLYWLFALFDHVAV